MYDLQSDYTRIDTDTMQMMFYCAVRELTPLYNLARHKKACCEAGHVVEWRKWDCVSDGILCCENVKALGKTHGNYIALTHELDDDAMKTSIVPLLAGDCASTIEHLLWNEVKDCVRFGKIITAQSEEEGADIIGHAFSSKLVTLTYKVLVHEDYSYLFAQDAVGAETLPQNMLIFKKYTTPLKSDYNKVAATFAWKISHFAYSILQPKLIVRIAH